MASKRYSTVERSNCVACGTCVTVCPKEAIKVIRGCYAAVNSGICIGCNKCGKVCPTGCITLVERGETK